MTKETKSKFRYQDWPKEMRPVVKRIERDFAKRLEKKIEKIQCKWSKNKDQVVVWAALSATDDVIDILRQ
ncbi:MAG: hypothetical protein AB7F19_07860 [Candidatus Babeliales bacterium]